MITIDSDPKLKRRPTWTEIIQILSVGIACAHAIIIALSAIDSNIKNNTFTLLTKYQTTLSCPRSDDVIVFTQIPVEYIHNLSGDGGGYISPAGSINGGVIDIYQQYDSVYRGDCSTTSQVDLITWRVLYGAIAFRTE